MIKRCLSLIFLVLLFEGCSVTTRTNKNCPVLLSHELSGTGDVKRFSLPSNVLCYSSNLELTHGPDGKEYLYFLGKENTMLIYDFNDKKLVKEIRLHQDGPDAIGIASGFKVFTKDSILITSRFTQDTFVINEAGQKIKTISYRNDDLKTSTTRCDHAVSIFVKDHHVYIPQYLGGNWNYLAIKDFEEYRTTLDFDIVTKTSKRIGLALPFHVNEYKTKSQVYSVTEFGDSYLFGFNGSDSIFITKDFENFESYFCASQYVKPPLANFLGTNDVQKIVRLQIESSSYENLVWDPYRKVIYRFYKIGKNDLKTDDNLFDIRNFPPSFGIMVLDSDLDIIADQVFPPNKYFFSNCFVSSEGLYLSINHPSNQDMDYNYLTYELIQLKIKS